jgi:AcrR family transcriptional regulator
MGTLGEINTRRGLPRGRSSLPPDVVAGRQRERVLRAMVTAAATLGYRNVRIADVVNRARVSRQSFYALFADKEECFLAAHADGVELIIQRLARWPGPLGDDDPAVALRNGIRAYLQLADDEREFAHCMLIELPAIGPAGLAARVAAHRQIADLIRTWHEDARETRPDWPAVSRRRYAAAVGAVHDLLFDVVASGYTESAAALTDEAANAVLALLGIDDTAGATGRK